MDASESSEIHFSLLLSWIEFRKNIKPTCRLMLDSIFVRCLINFNSSDGRVVRAFASGAIHSGLIPIRVNPMTLKLVFTASLLDFSIKGTVWRTTPQVYLLCRWERHLTGFPHLGVVDRRLATP